MRSYLCSKVVSVGNISEKRGEVLLNAQLGLYAFEIFRYPQEKHIVKLSLCQEVGVA